MMKKDELVDGTRLCALCRSHPLRVGYEEDSHMAFVHGCVALSSFNGISDGRYALVNHGDEYTNRRDFGNVIENNYAPPSYFANINDTAC